MKLIWSVLGLCFFILGIFMKLNKQDDWQFWVAGMLCLIMGK